METKPQEFWDKKNERDQNRILVGMAINNITANKNIDSPNFISMVKNEYKKYKQVYKELKEEGENI